LDVVLAMNKKTIVYGTVAALSIITVTSIFISDTENLEETFFVTATYYEQNRTVVITFQDRSEKTNLVTLEVLGMETSFQKKFNSSYFSKNISLSSEPKYGWASIPVTFVVEHQEFGKVGIKTEIRSYNQIPAEVIFTKNLN